MFNLPLVPNGVRAAIVCRNSFASALILSFVYNGSQPYFRMLKDEMDNKEGFKVTAAQIFLSLFGIYIIGQKVRFQVIPAIVGTFVVYQRDSTTPAFASSNYKL